MAFVRFALDFLDESAKLRAHRRDDAPERRFRNATTWCPPQPETQEAHANS